MLHAIVLTMSIPKLSFQSLYPLLQPTVMLLCYGSTSNTTVAGYEQLSAICHYDSKLSVIMTLNAIVACSTATGLHNHTLYIYSLASCMDNVSGNEVGVL